MAVLLVKCLTSLEDLALDRLEVRLNVIGVCWHSD